MKLSHEFCKLPLQFDVKQMQREIAKFSDNDWQPHHEHFEGNYSIPLISVNGEQNNAFKGKMLPTPSLTQSSYLQQVLGSFNEVLGRSRLMKLEQGCEVPLHSDINYYWYNRVRIHVPIVTDPNVTFYCGDKKVHMAEGEAWIFDSWKNHKVFNDSAVSRVHLVIDISGSSNFWEMVNNTSLPPLDKVTQSNKYLPFKENSLSQLFTEKFNVPVVMNPGELDGMLRQLSTEIHSVVTNDTETLVHFEQIMTCFSQDWRQLWAKYGLTKDGWEFYHRCRDNTFQQAKKLGNQLKISNGGTALQMLIHCIIDPALNPEVA